MNRKAMKAMGTRFRAARLLAGWSSQEKFAREVGLSRNSVTRIELGLMNPSVDTLETWADACAVSVDLLLGRGPQ